MPSLTRRLAWSGRPRCVWTGSRGRGSGTGRGHELFGTGVDFVLRAARVPRTGLSVTSSPPSGHASGHASGRARWGVAAPVSQRVVTWVMAQYPREAAEVGRCSQSRTSPRWPSRSRRSVPRSTASAGARTLVPRIAFRDLHVDPERCPRVTTVFLKPWSTSAVRTAPDELVARWATWSSSEVPAALSCGPVASTDPSRVRLADLDGDGKSDLS